jgi:hypothetical protein
MSIDTAVRLAEYFLRKPETAEFGPYDATCEGEPLSAEELIPDRLYRLRMVDREERTVDVQIFLGIGDIGGLMWEQDVRALLRIAGMGHPALPEVLDAGYRSEAETQPAGVDVAGMAFVATRGSRRSSGRREVEHFATRQAEALRQFRSLADGLANLQHLGIAHRNVCPATIDVYPGSALRLARFELSALVSDLFRATLDSASQTDELRALLLQQSSYTLAYAPPERIAFMLADDTMSDLIENDRTDVYGLGAVAWEWFMGAFPVAEVPPIIAAVPTPAQAAGVCDAYTRFNRYLRTAIVEAAHVPPELARIIAGMLDPDPDRRPSPDAVIGLLTSSYDRIMASWDPQGASRPYAIAFMPGQFIETVHRWGWTEHHPKTEQGTRDLAEFIATDLRGAYMTHSPHGADPFVRGGARDAKRMATQVLRGTQGVWFCHYYRPEDEHGVMGAPNEHVLVIKYVADNTQPWVDKRLKELDWTQSRLVPEVELLPTTLDPDRMDRRIAHRPTWRNLVESTASAIEESPQDLAYKQAIDWLIDYQDVELQARMYPFVRGGYSEAGDALVHYDEARDLKRIHNSPLFVKFASSPKLRPEFGTYFQQLENQDGGADVDIVEDRDGRPVSRRALAEAEVVDQAGLAGTTGPDRILLRGKDGASIPERGWIRARDDRGSLAALDRQREASNELQSARLLLGQIQGPHTIRTLRRHWDGAGRDLKGDGARAVEEMLVCEPFSAIQGPPGTGKTRVAAAAVAAYLSKNQTARVLVSAQSNYALDNLAERLLSEIGAMDEQGNPVDHELDQHQPIALRVTSRALASADRVKKSILPWTRHALADRQSIRIQRHVGKLLRDPNIRLPVGLPDVLRDWENMLGQQHDSVIPELSDRLHRGANLVFATCAASMPELLSPAASAVFDWVVVEEAAKAWPTELAIPLVRGLRWTLIGDHFQLPAHRKNELRQFLDSCIGDPHEGIAVVGASREQYLAAFDLFGELFRNQKEYRNRQPPPLLRMSVQFRMRKPIGELVSRVFYQAEPQPKEPPGDGLPAGGLETYVDPDPAKRLPPVTVTTPAELDGQSLVWLDTGDLSSCRDEPHWSNPGEAAVVRKLLERLKPFPRKGHGTYSETPLAILSPYRAQNLLLGGLDQARGAVSTIHAFQGREADTVIVSLVRDRDRGGGSSGRVQGSLGHLSQKELVNVLFSRARRQLVIVGRFDFYASIMGKDGFWTQVCRAVELNGTIVSARGIFGDLPPLVGSRFSAAPADLAESGRPW